MRIFVLIAFLFQANLLFADVHYRLFDGQKRDAPYNPSQVVEIKRDSSLYATFFTLTKSYLESRNDRSFKIEIVSFELIRMKKLYFHSEEGGSRTRDKNWYHRGRMEIVINGFIEYGFGILYSEKGEIKYEPRNLSSEKVKEIGQIQKFDAFKSDVKKFNGGFVKPMITVQLKYQEETDKYIYKVKGNYSKTSREQRKKGSYNVPYNWIELNAITGEILNSGSAKQHYSKYF